MSRRDARSGIRGHHSRGGRVLGALLALGLAVGACDSGPKGPVSLGGTLEGPVALGAAVIEMRGTGIEAFDGAGSTRVFSQSTAEGVHRVVLVGETAGDLRFTVRVTDPDATVPTAVVLSATDGSNQPVQLPQAFTVRVVR